MLAIGDDLVGHKTYVMAGDGCLMEGISQEACSLAGHLKLNRLIVMFDDNHITIDGATSLANSTNTLERFDAMGWKTLSCDGNNPDDVRTALDAAQTSDRPVLIACRTTIGYGLPTKAGTNKAHGEAPGAEENAGARKNLDWPYAPFVIPDDIAAAWRKIGSRGAVAHAEWTARKAKADPALRAKFEAALTGDMPKSMAKAIAAHKAKLSAEATSMATRKSSEAVLNVINAETEITIGGSADLTGSNNTLTKGMVSIAPGEYAGRYIHYGIREHGMAAAMNGMTLHGGLLPYSGGFLVFSDYARPAIRLAALMGAHVVHVLTHDSIGLGEDGPTHQPVEHLAALRAIPGLLVFRPADAVETAECWEIALNTKQPSALALTRQNLPTLRTTHTDDNLCAKGGYELAASDGKAAVTILATGSEVEIAIAARDLLQAKGTPTRVVTLPCWELFDAQPADYREKVLGPDTVRVGVEAAIPMGWDRYLGAHGRFVGMHGFGASAPAKDLYKHFGITADAVAEAAMAALAAAK